MTGGATQQPDPITHLNAVQSQVDLGRKVSKVDFATARRFADIGVRDWVIVFFEGQLHLARVLPDLASAADHPLNRGGELFKFRRIEGSKSFRLSRLPDPYRLIPSSGRSNVHEFQDPATRSLVTILADSADEQRATQAIHALSAMDWLACLGPTAWESFCLGFLILEEGFVPTGLAVGRTLPDVDIVGRDRDGHRVLASCKKNPNPIAVPPEFAEACQGFGPDSRFFLFAYGGCNEGPEWARVVTRQHVEAWVQTERGERYLAMWR